MKQERINISAEIIAPADKVWEYWTNPKHIVGWNFGSDDWCCPWATNDFKVGGKYVARMEAKDGSFGFDFAVIYDEIIEHQKIAYTMEDGRVAITEFEETDGKTSIKTMFDAENENSIELQKQGWQSILNNFKTYTENN